jgi:hypothetical protein
VAHREGRERPQMEPESKPGVWLIFFMTPKESGEKR